MPEPHLYPSCSYTLTTVCSFEVGRADRSKSINRLEGGQELFRVEDRVRTEISLNKGGREDRSKLINR